MTKDSRFVEGNYMDRKLPPIGTQTEYGKIERYNQNTSIDIGGIVLSTITGNSHQDTLDINGVQLLDCKANKYWIL